MQIHYRIESHRMKGGTTDEAFEKQCFLWGGEASVKADLSFFLTFKVCYIHKNLKKKQEKKMKRHYMSPLTCHEDVQHSTQINIQGYLTELSIYITIFGTFSQKHLLALKSGQRQSFNWKFFSWVIKLYSKRSIKLPFLITIMILNTTLMHRSHT